MTPARSRTAALLACSVFLLALAKVGAAAPEPCGCGPRTFDCNQNGIEDAVDIATGSSSDANGNGVPDECERDSRR